ncbi:MAG: MoaD/ThiS family protein [Bacteroidetes bacterium]|nr:MoaD/ThiS family protein [Bacteroidota bacterium]MBK7139429.1 MoaD/ThiS family protein [Bacteroidota bacterium]MBL0286556.1 MoaD/ThiS family protein [Bacteroidota bacterium]
MHLKILFFGQLTDITQTTKMDLNESLSTAFELDAFLKKEFPDFKNHKYQIAINQKIINTDINLNEGDEIAFLPPFSGG